MAVEDRLQLKNYLVQVLRLRKHLLLYYSRVSNCSIESMVLRSKIGNKLDGTEADGEATYSHKIIVALAEFGNFVKADPSHAAAVFG